MHLKRQCSLLMVLCSIGVLGYPRDTEHQTGKRGAEREKDGGDSQARTLELKMNKAHPPYEDDYMCYSSEKLPDLEYIVQMEADATSQRAHHILIYGCEEAARKPHTSWQCGAICNRGGPKILWAWAKNADPTHVPESVGFPVGKSQGINQIVMQIHYKDSIPASEDGDESGVILTLTKQRQQYNAGLFVFVKMRQEIPPHSVGVHADVSCKYNGQTDIHPFAYRVHAHSLGRVISAYHNNGSWYEIGKGNPQWPQAFYPLKESMIIKPGEKMAARCTYDAPNMKHTVHVGGTHKDEMCNFYMMYYTEARNNQQLSLTCGGNMFPGVFGELPADNDKALPSNPALEEQAEDPNAPHVHVHGHMPGETPEEPEPEPQQPEPQETSDEPDVRVATGNKQSVVEVVGTWPQFKPADDIKLGQVAAVAVDSKNIVHIFHRGPRKWDGSSFNMNNEFTGKDPIDVNTIVSIDEDGNVIKQWGANMFFMPHGLHIDSEDNIWVTDVALHQVFKFPAGKTQASLIVGKRLKPGSDSESFCKPTDVAVLKGGEFFVSDGYCNHRIMKFSKQGKFIKKWGNATTYANGDTHSPEPYAFDIPHSITVLENKNKSWVCVADRENGRIQCFDYEGKFTKEIHPTEFNSRLFAISYSPVNGALFAVDGKDMYDKGNAPRGFVLDPDDGMLVHTFKPNDKGFEQPHDIAVCPTGEHVYVAEIGPNKIWKFNVHLDRLNVLLRHRSVKKQGFQGVELVKRPSSTGTDHDTEAEKQLEDAEDDSKDMGASLVIGCLLIIPVIIIVAATIFVRIRKTAKRRGYTKADVLLASDSDTYSDSEDELYEHTLYESPAIKKQVRWGTGNIDGNHVPGNLHSLPFTAVTKTDGSI